MNLHRTVLVALSSLALVGTAATGFAQGSSSGNSSDKSNESEASSSSSSASSSDSASAASNAAAAANGMKVLKAKTAAGGVKKREPVDVTSSFSKGDEVTVWVSVRNPDSPSNVKLVWKAGDIEIETMDLEVGKSWRWRTWGQIKPIHTGDWTVEVQGPDGETLKTVEFSVSGG